VVQWGVLPLPETPMHIRLRRLPVVLLLCLLGLGRPASAGEEEKGAAAAPPTPALTTKWMQALSWRPIGPASMGGRITALAVNPQDATNWWAASASGGLLKTVDNGITFEHQFDKEATVSIGDVAVSASNPRILWVGTGESNPRNSVSWGNGVYQSVDGGRTWKHRGLDKTFQIGAVRIHPRDPQTVYVGAMGRCWGASEERGLYKTTDGGKTWKKILFVDDKTGVIDVQMHPRDPDTLLVATWERQRDGFDTNDPAVKWGAGSGLWKTSDGGASFRRIESGLPTGKLGRIGLDYFAGNPDVAFAVIESERIGMEPENAPYLGITGRDAEVGARLTQVMKDTPAAKAGLEKDDIVIRVGTETVHSYGEMLRLIRQSVAGESVEIEVSRKRARVVVAVELGTRPVPKAKEGEEAPVARPFGVFLGGQRENRQTEQGEAGHEYGGIYKTTDGGESWTRINSLNPRPMYFSEIRVDPQDEKRIWVLGIRLWRSKDGGETFTPDGHPNGVHVDHHALWIDPANGRHLILGNDGGLYVSYDGGGHYDHLNHVAIGQFYDVGVGPRRDYRVYGGLQDNGSWGGPSRSAAGSGPSNADWFRVSGGDGFRVRVDPNDPEQIYFESQNGGVGRRHLGSGERRGLTPRPAKGQKERYRFNWNTPFVLSSHNSRIYYVAGNRVFTSLDRGNQMRALSPEITHTERGSATALSESPLDAQVLYVGTDDGALWRTQDGGHTWTDLYTLGAASPTEAGNERPAGASATTEGEGGGDGDGDGDADATEEAALSPEIERSLGRMLAWDVNRDGSLQRVEVPTWIGTSFFTNADTDKDGVLTRAELLVMAARAAADDAGDEGLEAQQAPTEAAALSAAIGVVLPERRWVSWLEASRTVPGRVYAVFDGHRSDDDRAHVYVSEDFGTSWRSLTERLPTRAGTTRVLREDIVNSDVLYLGTEFGAWVSIDRGTSWASLHTNLPTVAVHAFAQHPDSGELVAATHGRSLWILDVTPLRQMGRTPMQEAVTLFRPNTAIQWRPQPSRGEGRTFRGENPPAGAQIFYALAAKRTGVKIEILGHQGEVLRVLEGPGGAGLQRVTWDVRRSPGVDAQGRRRRVGPRVGAGVYRVRLRIGEESWVQDLEVALDPSSEDAAWLAHEDAAEEAAAEKRARKAIERQPNDTDRDE
jgi:photosystem II stability/assembly factor-like uncharacterized protein